MLFRSLELSRGNNGAEIRCFIQRVTHFHGIDLLGHLLHKRVHNGFMHEHARRGGATLSLARKTHSGHSTRPGLIQIRSEERRAGKECPSPWRSRWRLYHKKKKKK